MKKNDITNTIIDFAIDNFIILIIDTNNQYKEFWKHYTRLTKNKNPQTFKNRSSIVAMIDKATEFENIAMQQAFDFFMETCIMPISYTLIPSINK